jgi:hypothetical protein
VVVDEGAGTVTVTLKLSRKAPQDASFDWTTFDGSSVPGYSRPSRLAARHDGRSGHHSDRPGLATAGEDYTASSGTVTIAAGTRRATVTIPIIDDSIAETKEVFFVGFKPTRTTSTTARRAAHREGYSTGWCAGSHGRATATVVITDND